VLDPACGAGTILVEAAALVPSGVVCGGDIDPSALETAQANLQAAGIPAELTELNEEFDLRQLAVANNAETPIALLYQGDATDLRLGDRTVDAVLSNLPWGKQVTAETDLALLYRGILTTIERVLAPGGRAVLLTDQAEPMLAALEACPALHLATAVQISLYGRHPTLYVIATP
jgi:23S rRNA G2445 N2-methylase RlmL